MANHGVDDVDSVVKFLQESDEQERKLTIEPKALAEELNSPNPPKLLDIRTPDEFEIAKIPGGKLVDQAMFHEMMTTWDKGTPIVCYCHVGERSIEAASYLLGHGFTNVKSLAGGIDAWSEQIDPTIPQY